MRVAMSLGFMAETRARGELDGERDAVEAAADLDDRGGVRRFEGEPGACGRGAFDEQEHGVVLA